MWNPIKIWKLTKVLWSKGQTDLDLPKDELETGDVIRELITQMELPSNLRLMRHYMSSTAGRDILWGREDKAKKYQLQQVLPVITNEETMSTYAPNTVGGHYGHLIKQWSFEELWAKRFDDHVKGNFGGDDWRLEVRKNVARHVFLCHDFQHILFRYDTTSLGEMAIQVVTYGTTKHSGPRYASWVLALRGCWDYESWEPMRIRKEAMKIVKNVDPALWTMNPLDMIGKDVEEARKEYNIGFPTRFASFVKLHEKDFRICLLYTSPSPRDRTRSRMPSSA